MVTILCIATYFKGEAFLKECRSKGCRVLLLTSDTLAGAAWPRDAIDEIHTIPRDADPARIRQVVDGVARRHHIDRIAALDDFDVEMAGMLREHLQVQGFGRTTAGYFRDKLAMRIKARAIGIPVPEFSPVFTDSDVNDWTAHVPPPWVLKPRSSAAALGIKKVASHDELWRALDATGDQRSLSVLEQFVPGEVYHVDSIVCDGRVAFAIVFKYGQPPMQIAHEGGIFITRRLPDDSADARALIALNARLQTGFGMGRGVSHSEFIGWSGGSGGSGGAGRSGGPGGFVFLETSARVGGAFIVDTIEAATGINLWREWAKIEIAGENGGYAVPSMRRDYAGVVLSLARQEEPDMSSFTDPEIKTIIRKHHHAGVIVASPDPARIEALLANYTDRFYKEFFATVPPPERPAE
jgi:biotin carboxylase